MHTTNTRLHLLRLSKWRLRFLSNLAHANGNTALGKRLADIYAAR
jgi:hypothetical protein